LKSSEIDDFNCFIYAKSEKMTASTTDNIYPVGTRTRAWVNPEQELVIHKYYQRIYYCVIVAKPEHDHLAYFERELMPSVTKE
jgi:hypothetical protein